MIFSSLLAVVAVIAAVIAAITGFGIGSLLTPVLGTQVETRLAVAAVAIPHFMGTVQRLWILRRHVERRVVLSFGIMSALGGLGGALLQSWMSNRTLGLVFGSLVILASISELSGWMGRIRWGRTASWIAGTMSGLLGGLVGNQGGVRSAAMLGFDVPKESFVATATAIALFVDVARLPVYLLTQGHATAALWRPVLVATAGVIVGTILGTRLLRRLPQEVFRSFVAILLLLLGIYMIVTRGA